MSTDILPSQPESDAASSSSRSPLRLVLSGVVVVLVLALIGGVTVAVRGLSGGGSQPEDVLPGGAFAFAKVDLDPSAGQKINALRFLRKFPALRDKVSLDADLREALFEGVAEEAGWGELDFDKDVSPWLGSRIAIAAYAPAEGEGSTGSASGSASGYAALPSVPAAAPSAEEFDPEGDYGTDVDGTGDLSPFGGPVPTIVVALQVTDSGKARAGLDKLIAATPDAPDPGVVIQDGYALLAPDQKAAEQAAKDAEKGVLAADEEFGSDLAALGDGVASAWVDMDGVSTLAGLTGFAGAGVFGLGGIGPGGAGSAGRTAWVLKFDGADALEVRGAVTGAKPVAGSDQKLQGFAELPEDSVVAFGLAGGDKMVPNVFEQLRAMFDDMGADGPEGGFDEMIADAERELGIDLPDDLAVLLGSNLVGSLREGTLRDGEVEIGARVTTDGPRAMAVVDQLKKAAGGQGEDLPIFSRLTDDGMIVASSAAQVDRLAAPGELGERDFIGKALPDLDGSTVALWVDIAGISSEFFGDDVDENLEPLEGVGMTVRMHEDGSADYRLRLVTN